jgi:hypothetical protein
VDKCAHEADWYAEHGPKIMADEPAPANGDLAIAAGLREQVRRGTTTFSWRETMPEQLAIFHRRREESIESMRIPEIEWPVQNNSIRRHSNTEFLVS